MRLSTIEDKLQRAVERFQNRQDSVDGAEAFRPVAERCHPILQRYFRRKQLPQDVVDDLTQDTLLRLYRKVDDYAFRGPFLAYMYQIARSIFHKWLRKSKTRPTTLSIDTPIDDEDGPSFDLEDPQDLPDHHALRLELAARVRELVKQLPPQRRACIELFYFQELAYKDIADRLGATSGAVGANINFAKRQLKKALETRGFGPEGDARPRDRDNATEER